MVRPIAILGAGLTGLSTAHHLRKIGPRRPLLLAERAPRVGGKAQSERRDGYTFDVTGHWLHLRDERVKALTQTLFEPGDLTLIERVTGVYTHGVMLAYPFQANLHGLPLPVVKRCLAGLLEAQATPPQRPPLTFDELVTARFGRGIAETFFVPYNTKLWGAHYHRLTPDWVQRFVPFPDPEQIIAGAIGLRQEGLGYNATFLYPKGGGIDALPEAFRRELDGVDLRTDTEVEQIDTDKSRVRLGGQWVEYHQLISTLPLPELIARMPNAPPAVREATGKLRWMRWRYLDVATRTPSPIREHWVYVPEMHLPFFRVGIYTNALAAMAPEGGSGLYVELTDRDTAPDVSAILRELATMGAITDPNDVVFCETRDVEYAYVVFDENYDASRRTIHDWLETVGVLSTGRYGSWTYNSMEDCIILGMEAAAWAAR